MSDLTWCPSCEKVPDSYKPSGIPQCGTCLTELVEVPMDADETVVEGTAPPHASEQLTPEQILESASAVRKDRWLAIFIELSRSPRFAKFVEDNYVISDGIDEENRVITTTVVEKPLSVGPRLSPVQLVNLGSLLMKSGCTDVSATVDAVIKLLGQEAGALISVADYDLQNMKRKLDA